VKKTDLKMEKVKNFQRNYLESEKFFSKFSFRIFLKGKISKSKTNNCWSKILTDLKVEKVKNFQRNYLESEKFFSKFSYFLERACTN